MRFGSILFGAGALIVLSHLSTAVATPIAGYNQTNLVSDIPGRALHTDPGLQNPWGISFGPSTPFWISNNGAGVSGIYDSDGTRRPLTVSIPAPGGGTSAPTGQAFDATGAFSGDIFLFATENGTIAGWRGALGTQAETLVDNSPANAIYKGLESASVDGHTYLFAADFHNSRVDVIPSSGAPALAGNFTDPNLPSGYAPFNIRNLNGQFYVTYAKQDASGTDEEAGAGLGFVSVFDLHGNFVKRFASDGSLNAPWGLAMTPAGWNLPAGDVLVGNFGDGTINAYDANGTLVGPIASLSGTPLVNDGLWAITFGNGGAGGNTTSLYLTAGLNDEANGLFARIDAVPEPGTSLLFTLGFASLGLLRRKRPDWM